jgi:hypothetical protein
VKSEPAAGGVKSELAAGGALVAVKRRLTDATGEPMGVTMVGPEVKCSGELT